MIEHFTNHINWYEHKVNELKDENKTLQQEILDIKKISKKLE